MRRLFNIFGLALLGSALALTSTAVAGGPKHSSNQGSHNNQNHSNQNHSSQTQSNKLPLFQQGNKLAAGNKNGLGFIADPVRRPLTTKTGTSQGNFIADPLHLKPNTSPGPAVVRDHSLPNPNYVPPTPRARYDSIQGGGLGLDLNPFDFKAPMNFDKQVRDHRTPTSNFPGQTGYPGSGRTGNQQQPWTPSSTGPANRSPTGH